MELKQHFTVPCEVTDFLLIVPYGIETIRNRLNVFLTQLLIVPYGIETRASRKTTAGTSPFNCTLWN